MPCGVSSGQAQPTGLKSWFQYLLRDLAQFCNLRIRASRFFFFFFNNFSNEKSNNNSFRRLLMELSYIKIIYKIIRTSPAIVSSQQRIIHIHH